MDLRQFKKKYNLTDLELLTQIISSHKISFTANKLKQTESNYINGQALRLIKDKKFSFTANYGKADPEEMLKQAIDLCKYSAEVNFEFPGNETPITETKNIIDMDFEKLVNSYKQKGEEIIDTVLSSAKSNKDSLLVDVTFDITTHSDSLKNSNGTNYSYSNQFHSFSVNLRETLENDFIEIYTTVTDDSVPDYKNYVNKIIELYKSSKKTAKIKSGSYPVLFTSKASKELFGIIETALNGKLINQKSSPWHDKLGSMVLSNQISIKQDPGFGHMAKKCDDEGSLVKPLTLIKNGVLENFYFDLLSASKSQKKTASTGNGFKSSLASQPEPSLLNMIVPEGDKTLGQIIKNIDYGLLIDQTIGGLSTNISGDMSVNVDLGFLIERGEIIGRIKDTMISGNIYHTLSNIIELSNSPKWYWSNIYSPDILLNGFTITTKN